MLELLAIACGGAISRFWLSQYITDLLGNDFPYDHTDGECVGVIVGGNTSCADYGSSYFSLRFGGQPC